MNLLNCHSFSSSSQFSSPALSLSHTFSVLHSLSLSPFFLYFFASMLSHTLLSFSYFLQMPSLFYALSPSLWYSLCCALFLSLSLSLSYHSCVLFFLLSHSFNTLKFSANLGRYIWLWGSTLPKCQFLDLTAIFLEFVIKVKLLKCTKLIY